MVYVNHGGLALGIFSFGIAHIFYIRAFGWKNTNVKIGFLLYTISLLGTTSTMTFHFLFVGKFQGLHFLVVMTGVIIYCLLLYTTFWRAVDLEVGASSKDIAYYVRVFGLASFVISDSIIALDQFAFAIPYAWVPIMLLYYVAQGSIAWAEGSQVLTRNLEKRND